MVCAPVLVVCLPVYVLIISHYFWHVNHEFDENADEFWQAKSPGSVYRGFCIPPQID